MFHGIVRCVTHLYSWNFEGKAASLELRAVSKYTYQRLKAHAFPVVQVSDTTKLNSSNAAKFKKIIIAT